MHITVRITAGWGKERRKALGSGRCAHTVCLTEINNKAGILGCTVKDKCMVPSVLTFVGISHDASSY